MNLADLPPARLSSSPEPASPDPAAPVPSSPVLELSGRASAALLEAPILAEVRRGGFVESVHRASAVVTNGGDEVELALGDVSSPIFPRSSNKPLQALAMVRAGLAVSPVHLALVCASHSGEEFHIAGVREILASVGLTEADLRNTPDYPIDDAAREQWIRAGRGKESLAQNCSGKHAGMIATSVSNGWDHSAYLSEDHPVQRACAATISELAGEDVAATAVDGCGAPVMAISLAGLARAFGALASAADGTPEARVAEAMRAHPDFVGGTGRDVTTLIASTPGVIAKDGAEAVYAAGLRDGRGLAVKVADGGQRARPVILAALLRRIGVESEALAALSDAPILGHGEPVGSVVAVGI